LDTCNKVLGVDLDPKKDMEHKILPDGDIDVKYKGSKMRYGQYLDEMEERATNKQEGKPIVKSSIGMFSGFGEGTLRKPYQTNNKE